MTEPTLFDVFFSHNSLDKPLVAQIARRLVDETKLRPLLDKWHLIPGVEWQPELEDALRRSKTVAVVIGPSGNGPWHHEEMQVALKRAVREQQGFRVIPVLLPEADASSMSEFLQLRTYVDFSAGTNDEIAFNRLVASILGKAGDGEFAGITLPDEPAPYRGLMQFKPEHARFFFGREQDIGPTRDKPNLIDKLRTLRFVAVVGSSGSGKSSIVGAGLLPRLAQDAISGSRYWHTVTFAPADDPWRALAVAMASSHPPDERGAIVSGLLRQFDEPEAGLRHTLESWFADMSEPIMLFVDQFEELFTQAPTNAAARDKYDERVGRFVRQLAHEVLRPDGRFRVVITLRADFLPHCLRMPELKGLLQDRQLLLGELATDEVALRELIQRPAQEVGAMLETGLMEVLLADVRRQTGTLSLLEHTLSELWRERRGPWLTLAAYQKTGGIGGAAAARTLNIPRTLFQQINDRVLGYDFFISYHWASGGQYAVKLAEYLRKQHYIVFLDRTDYASGDDWKAMGEIALKNTKRLVLIATREAVTGSKPVEREVEIFTKRRRHVIPIYFGDKFMDLDRSQFPTLDRMSESTLFIDESAPQPLSSGPDKKSVDELIRTIGVMRQRTMRALLIAIPIFLAGASLILAGQSWYQAVESAKEARTSAADEEKQRIIAVNRQNKAEIAETNAKSNETRTYLTLADNKRQDGQLEDQLYWYVRAAINGPANDTQSQSAANLLGSWSRALKSTFVHDGPVNAVAFAPGGKLVLSAGQDGRACLWDATSGELLCAPLVHPGPVTTATFGGLGRVLTGCADGNARIWNTATGTLVCPPLPHKGPITAVAFSNDLKTVGTGSQDHTARVWNSNTGAPQCDPLPHGRAISVVVYSPNSEYFATGSHDQTARVWDAKTGQPLTEPLSHSLPVTSATFAENGKVLATGCGDTSPPSGGAGWEFLDVVDITLRSGEAVVWTLQTEAGPPTSVVLEHKSPVSVVAISPDDKRLMTGCWNLENAIQLWDVKDHLWDKKEAYESHGTLACGPVKSAVFDRSGQTILTGSRDNTARSWNSDTRAPMSNPLVQSDWINAVAISPDGNTALTGSRNGMARLWDVTSLQSRGTLLEHDGPVLAAAFSADGTTVVTAEDRGDMSSGDSTLHAWDATTGAQRFPKEPKKADGQVLAISVQSNSQIVVAATTQSVGTWDARSGSDFQKLLDSKGDHFFPGACAADGKSAIVGSDTNIWFVSCNDSSPARSIPFDGYRAVRKLALSPDGAVGAAAVHNATDFSGKSTQVLAWDLKGKPLGTPLLPEMHVYSLAMSSDNNSLVAGCTNVALLWDTRRGSVKKLVHDGIVYAVAYSPNGRWVMTGSGDLSAQLWDSSNGEPRGDKFTHHAPVRTVTFSPDNRTAATACEEGNVRLWDVATGAPWGQVYGIPNIGGNPILDVRFNPNGDTMLTRQDGDGEKSRVWLWRIAAPATLDPETLELSLEVRTGYRWNRENGTKRPLRHDEWLNCHQRLRTLRD